MKTMRFFLLSSIIGFFYLLTGSLSAQTGVETGTPWGTGQDSIKCREAVSLLTSYAKSENYKDALDFFEKAYAECPGSSKNIYIYGPRILGWLYNQAPTKEKKAAIFQRIMKLYDDRATYFGDDPKYSKDWILSQKITEYLKYIPQENYDYDLLYSWTKPFVTKEGETAHPQVVYFYVFSSLNKAIGNKAWHNQYVDDYMRGNGYLENSLELAENNQDSVQYQYISGLKSQLDNLFARSGLADCKMLVEIFGRDLEANKNNANFLQAMIDLFRYADCETEKIYFTASKYMFAIKPTASSAMGLAKDALQRKQYTEAFEYLNKALGLTKEAHLRAAIYTQMGIIRKDQGSFVEARRLLNLALKENPSKGTPLLLIAQMYASSASSIFPDDPLKQRCVYYLVIDKLERARAIDPQISGEASRLISVYRRNLPAASAIFMHPDLESGQSFYVGGWIGESTTIR